ncbi:MAG: peptidoglycan-binding protein [Scytonematopsis contorta HA4267-MV1]|jgi:peptidoglycan hydrolase-like protein with peptidoglycan-binding domain|nr:peptidoglycan-binding protein [Scytonematopsis contorta HA4267-MV1]
MTTESRALPTLRRGSQGQQVKLLQDLLNQADRKQNFGNPPPLNIDGDFGANTETAVKNFQKYYGLTIDGVVGAKTWAKLQAVVNG